MAILREVMAKGNPTPEQPQEAPQEPTGASVLGEAMEMVLDTLLDEEHERKAVIEALQGADPAEGGAVAVTAIVQYVHTKLELSSRDTVLLLLEVMKLVVQMAQDTGVELSPDDLQKLATSAVEKVSDMLDIDPAEAISLLEGQGNG